MKNENFEKVLSFSVPINNNNNKTIVPIFGTVKHRLAQISYIAPFVYKLSSLLWECFLNVERSIRRPKNLFKDYISDLKGVWEK